MKPKRIFLVRHGQSEGNVDKSIYETKPDWKLNLTEKGKVQAVAASAIIADNRAGTNFMFYVSPFYRTRQTASLIIDGLVKELSYNAFDLFNESTLVKPKILYREDPRIREQEWGNYISAEMKTKIEDEREDFGRFFYRMSDGESAADVYDSVSLFLDTFHRDVTKEDFPENCVIVSHGLAIRVFLMRWYHWTVEEFQELANPKNCAVVEMELMSNGKYKLISELDKKIPKEEYEKLLDKIS